ncbi:MAG: ISAzo13 family transposase, partial [Endozoicomonadaceae bacterium]|nr:ISAzo13 family transposase [Endozoicomonadaceae bacterium]
KHYMEKTETSKGLTMKVRVIDKIYAKGRKYAKDFKKSMTILFDKNLPKWNYTVIPNTG